MSEEIKRLEEKIAYLEHHVTEQDREMMQFADDLARIKRELKALTGRLAAGSAASRADDASPENERPPHY